MVFIIEFSMKTKYTVNSFEPRLYMFHKMFCENIVVMELMYFLRTLKVMQFRSWKKKLLCFLNHLCFVFFCKIHKLAGLLSETLWKLFWKASVSLRASLMLHYIWYFFTCKKVCKSFKSTSFYFLLFFYKSIRLANIIC